jgi:hypothetical protein
MSATPEGLHIFIPMTQDEASEHGTAIYAVVNSPGVTGMSIHFHNNRDECHEIEFGGTPVVEPASRDLSAEEEQEVMQSVFYDLQRLRKGTGYGEGTRDGSNL